MSLFQTRILVVTLGLLSVSSVSPVESAYSEDAVSAVDDFSEPPPQVAPPRSHHHPHHHSHHHSSHEGRREHENHHYLQHRQHKHQHEFQHQHIQPHNVQEEQAQSHEEHEQETVNKAKLNFDYQEDTLANLGSASYGSYNKFSFNNPGNCRLPETWKSSWFQSGIPNPIQIDSKSIEGKGTCYESSGDKFLFVEKSSCHRCLVINQRHHNVLEYKESQDCESRNTLENLCNEIPGDAALYSLFRTDGQPIPCPFKGPFTFSYNRGLHGLCKHPVSHVDTCTEQSRLLMKYESCPNVLKSESTEEELECLGQWNDGPYRYLVGKLNYRLAVSNEDRYRCFIYEKRSKGFKVAMSGDATCSALTSPTEGARTLTFTQVTESGSKCRFPSFVSAHHWHTLDGKLTVKAHHKNSTMHIVDNSPRDSGSGGHHNSHHTNPSSGGVMYNSGNFGNSVTSAGMENPHSLFSGGTRITCQASKELSDEHVVVVAQHTEGCTSTPVCIHFYKRDNHVIELQIRKKGSRYYDDDECWKPTEAVGPNLPYVTLITAEVNSLRCPYLGKYMTTGFQTTGDLCTTGSSSPASSTHLQNPQNQHGAFHSVVVGCGQKATMDFHSKCVSQEPITSYECIGSWEENGTGFLIASPLSRSSTSARRFCFTYLETEEGGFQFFSSPSFCRRDVSPNVDGIWAFNLTVDGQCAEPMTGAGAPSTHCDLLYSSYFLAILVLLTL